MLRSGFPVAALSIPAAIFWDSIEQSFPDHPFRFNCSSFAGRPVKSAESKQRRLCRPIRSSLHDAILTTFSYFLDN
jgi:hypothetical protein